VFNRKPIFVAIASVVLLAAGISVRSAWAREDSLPSRPPSPAVLGQQEVTQLLFLLDQDRNGMVSKKEFMNFMSAEFDRLDKDKSGELDVKELRRSQLEASRPQTFSSVGK
jgi:hypothetical protein